MRIPYDGSLTRRSTLLGLVGLALGPVAGCAAPLDGQRSAVPPHPLAPHPSPATPAPAREVVSSAAEAHPLALPMREPHAETGSAFFARTCELDRIPFEDAIWEAISSGNVPAFERNLAALHMTLRDGAGAPREATLFVLCDYLAIGSDEDFLRIPMTPMTAQRIATATECLLPTTKLVDEIYRQATVKLPPRFIEGGPSYDNHRLDYVTHNKNLEENRLHCGHRLGELTAGDKKDIVISNRLVSHPYRVAIYGWHKRVDEPIQPLSTVHSCKYADYSHGVRLISSRMMLDGEPRRLEEVLRDPILSALVSDEGALEIVAYSTYEPPSEPGSKGARRRRAKS